MDLFFSGYFFQQSCCILEKWQVIIRQFTMTNNEVLDGLLRQYNQVEGLFVSKKNELIQKTLTFKRLAFVVFSSQIDQIPE